MPDDLPATGPAAQDLDQQILNFARIELGPVAERLLATGALRDAVHERVAQGSDVEDAVLGSIHGAMRTHPSVADEFAAYFLFDLMKMGKLSMTSSSRLRRFLDTGDLVLSVFGDIWEDVSDLQFETRNQFKTLFAQRIRWKAADQARRLHTQSRQEDRRVPQQPEELQLSAPEIESAPLPHSIRQEERQRLTLILLRLKNPRDRRLLTLYLKGKTIEDMAAELDLNYEATRKALSRAIDQARALGAASDQRR